MLAAAALLAAGDALAADQLLIDQGRRIGGLWLFPIADRPHDWRYLPNSARLATDAAGQPQFSFIRYVSNELSKASDKSITQAGGGGVIHFLVLYETPEEQVAAARRVLRKQAEKEGGEEAAKKVTLAPIVFDSGRYALVSSVLTQERSGDAPAEPGGAAAEGDAAAADGAGSDAGATQDAGSDAAAADDSAAKKPEPSKRRLLDTGAAPVLEGQRIALSFEIAPEQSTLLMESFRMATPDVSLVFDLVFNGLEDAYDAELVVDWDQFHTSGAFAAGGSAFFVSADIEVGFDQLRRDNAIKLVSRGASDTMESMVDRVYGKLLDFLFRPVMPEEVPEHERGDMMDALSEMTKPGGVLSSRSLFGFGAAAAFELKHYKTSGRSVMSFNQQDVVDRHAYITFNIGDLFARYGEDKRFFRTVNLDDATFQQREVHVSVDGQLAKELAHAINSVTVHLRKQHQDGSETVRELVIDRQKLEEQAGDLRMAYGWSEDRDRVAWLGYDYRTDWRFEGGRGFTTDWTRADSAMIDLLAPYQRQKIELMGDPEALSQRGVRAVIVKVEYPFFGETKKQQLVVRPAAGAAEGSIEITLPRGAGAYDYGLTWMLAGGGKREAAGRDENFFLMLDEIPEPKENIAPQEPAPATPAGAPAAAADAGAVATAS
jgi:hypothetical protein